MTTRHWRFYVVGSRGHRGAADAHFRGAGCAGQHPDRHDQVGERQPARRCRRLGAVARRADHHVGLQWRRRPLLLPGDEERQVQRVGAGDRAGARRSRPPTSTGRRSKVDFAMKETTDIVPQLSGYQIIAALPEDTVAHRRGKVLFQKNCTYCHETSAALRDRFDQAGWEAIVLAMTNGFTRNPKPLTPAQKELATYLTEMRGPGPSPMKPKVFRPTGEATLPVTYEYDVEYERGRLRGPQRQRLAVRPGELRRRRRRDPRRDDAIGTAISGSPPTGEHQAGRSGGSTARQERPPISACRLATATRSPSRTASSSVRTAACTSMHRRGSPISTAISASSIPRAQKIETVIPPAGHDQGQRLAGLLTARATSGRQAG